VEFRIYTPRVLLLLLLLLLVVVVVVIVVVVVVVVVVVIVIVVIMSGISSARNQAPHHKDLWSPGTKRHTCEYPLSRSLSYRQGTLLSKRCCWCRHRHRDDNNGYDQ
jgi:hypothetical protein